MFGRRAFPNGESNRHEGQRWEDASKSSGTARRPLWRENREWVVELHKDSVFLHSGHLFSAHETVSSTQ